LVGAKVSRHLIIIGCAIHSPWASWCHSLACWWFGLAGLILRLVCPGYARQLFLVGDRRSFNSRRLSGTYSAPMGIGQRSGLAYCNVGLAESLRGGCTEACLGVCREGFWFSPACELAFCLYGRDSQFDCPALVNRMGVFCGIEIPVDGGIAHGSLQFPLMSFAHVPHLRLSRRAAEPSNCCFRS